MSIAADFASVLSTKAAAEMEALIIRLQRLSARVAFIDIANIFALVQQFTLGFREFGRTVNAGVWTDVPYSQTNFTASAGTWTVDSGDQTTFAYTLIGKTMWVAFAIFSTDVSNAGVDLRITIPGGLTSVRFVEGVSRTSDAGAGNVFSLMRVAAAGTYIQIFSSPAGAGFAITAADNTSVTGQLAFEIQ